MAALWVAPVRLGLRGVRSSGLWVDIYSIRTAGFGVEFCMMIMIIGKRIVLPGGKEERRISSGMNSPFKQQNSTQKGRKGKRWTSLRQWATTRSCCINRFLHILTSTPILA